MEGAQDQRLQGQRRRNRWLKRELRLAQQQVAAHRAHVDQLTTILMQPARERHLQRHLEHAEAENARLRALLAALVERPPWDLLDAHGICHWCDAWEPYHKPACPYVAARAVVAERGEEGA